MHEFMSLSAGIIAFFGRHLLLTRYTVRSLHLMIGNPLLYKLRKLGATDELDEALMNIERIRHELEVCLSFVDLDYDFITESVIRGNKTAESVLRSMLQTDDGKRLEMAIKEAREHQLDVEEYLARYAWGSLYA